MQDLKLVFSGFGFKSISSNANPGGLYELVDGIYKDCYKK